MATGNAQIIREADNQWTLLFFTGEDLTDSQVNIGSAGAALDQVKADVAALPGTLRRIQIRVETVEP